MEDVLLHDCVQCGCWVAGKSVYCGNALTRGNKRVASQWEGRRAVHHRQRWLTPPAPRMLSLKLEPQTSGRWSTFPASPPPPWRSPSLALFLQLHPPDPSAPNVVTVTNMERQKERQQQKLALDRGASAVKGISFSKQNDKIVVV